MLPGGLYRLVLGAGDLGKVSVGAPYFNLTFVPILVLILILLLRPAGLFGKRVL